MKSLKLKTSLSSYGLASLQHPNAPLGMHGNVCTYLVIDIPEEVSTGTVLHQFNQTITVRGEVYRYATLGVGKIVFGEGERAAESREFGDYRTNEEMAAHYGEGRA